jgi:hypothetical protein
VSQPTAEQLAEQLVNACTCWVPAPSAPVTAYPGTMVTAINLPDGCTLALLKYPNPSDLTPMSKRPGHAPPPQRQNPTFKVT